MRNVSGAQDGAAVGTGLVPAAPASGAAHLAALDAVRRALDEAETLPDIATLIDQADALRVCARKMHLSTAGINAWARVRIDCARKAARRIEELRAAGLLSERGRPAAAANCTSLVHLLPTVPHVNQRAAEWRKLAAIPEPELDALFARANKAGRQVSPDMLLRMGGAQQAAARRREASRHALPLPDGMEYRIGDCRDVLADVPSDSVALVLTDPPYADEADLLYQWLAQWSARVLVPGGSLICYHGLTRVGQRMALLAAHLTEWSDIVMLHDQAPIMRGRFVYCDHKKVLWYTKGPRRGREVVHSVLRSVRDKSLHPWAQGTGGADELIEKLTAPGELICDPFAGTARWGHMAAAMGRRWLGADLEWLGTTRIEVGDAGDEPAWKGEDA